MPHARSARPCEVCTLEYRPTYREQRTCGRSCGVELRRRAGNLNAASRARKAKRPVVWPASKVYVGDCASCGEPFAARSKTRFCRRTACTRQRKRAADRVYNRGRPKVNPGPYPCPSCGQGQYQRVGTKCTTCRAEVRRAEKRRERQRHRAAKARAPVIETVILGDIAKRDGYRCGICRKPVRMTLLVPDLKAPTIDHIVPLSKGW